MKNSISFAASLLMLLLAACNGSNNKTEDNLQGEQLTDEVVLNDTSVFSPDTVDFYTYMTIMNEQTSNLKKIHITCAADTIQFLELKLFMDTVICDFEYDTLRHSDKVMFLQNYESLLIEMWRLIHEEQAVEGEKSNGEDEDLEKMEEFLQALHKQLERELN